MRAPRGTTSPTSRTVGKGFMSAGAAGVAGVVGVVEVGWAETGGAATVIVRVMVRETPSPSVTRSETSCSPAVNVPVAEEPSASLKSASPSKSQAWLVSAPSASTEVETSCTALPATGLLGLHTKPATGGALTRNTDTAWSLWPFCVASRRTKWVPGAVNECVTDCPAPKATPSISQLSALPGKESDVNVAESPAVRTTESSGSRWKAATGCTTTLFV